MTVVLEPETQAGKTIVPAGTWSADPAHSSVEFNVKHPAMLTTVTGRFANFEASVEAAREEPASARALALIEAVSIATNQSARGDDLRSPRFFDAATCPQIRFESRRIEHLKDGTFRIVGDLTIKDMTRELELDAIVQGVGFDPYGTERVSGGDPSRRAELTIAMDGYGSPDRLYDTERPGAGQEAITARE